MVQLRSLKVIDLLIVLIDLLYKTLLNENNQTHKSSAKPEHLIAEDSDKPSPVAGGCDGELVTEHVLADHVAWSVRVSND